GRDRLERPAGIGTWLGVPGLELTGGAGQENHQHALLGGLQFLGRRRLYQAAEAEDTRGRGAEEAAARNGVFGRVASIRAVHGTFLTISHFFSLTFSADEK